MSNGPVVQEEDRPPYAHSRNAAGRRQNLDDHLHAVADLAAGFAEPLHAAELARLAGLWHDLGKFSPEWQRYLLASEAGTQRRGTGPDHKGAGAILAAERCPALSLLIAGHHGGLPDQAELKGKLKEWSAAATTLCLVPEQYRLEPVPTALPPDAGTNSLELFLRFLFSALVDADFLDTERHLSPGKTAARTPSPSLSNLWETFARSHATLSHGDDPVSLLRAEVYDACLAAADLAPGLFRLTVPTGGGKTLSGMAFALRHALRHGHHRIIVAVPYTAITEQTASVYREAFGADDVVLEHHSALEPKHLNDQTEEGLWARLAAENWDASIIVTTTVQLFESLLAQKTSRCRKLHRIVGSVIILDEAQALPPSLLDPILDLLRTLTAEYGCSVVLCTATQPALDSAPGFKGLEGVREIVPNPSRLFGGLRRVRYDLPALTGDWEWERVAEEMRSEGQALTVTNTIADAQELFRVLGDADAFHLSTRLCGRHRRQVLDEVRRRLKANDPCLLSATQTVEAGVDIDFPLVLRALGPLDRIVQAAGRCNRNGKLPEGRVVVFRPREGGMPPGDYRTGTDQTAVILRATDADLHDPSLYERYFRSLFGKLDLDVQHIQELRRSFRYREVADRFRFIPEDTAPVLISFDEAAEELIDALRNEVPVHDLWRRLQPYTVAVRRRQLDEYASRGLVEPLPQGIPVWMGHYDGRLGLTEENRTLIA